MLYFSAHWCPPCRRFTPMLIQLYKKIKAEHNMELIFCSLDREEDEYKEYISDMPWLCLPFKAPEAQTMARKYKASGIPHLVVLDGSGTVITMDGTSSVREDPEGSEFPWKPKSFQEVWPDKILVTKGEGGSDDTFLSSSELKDKHLMLYFSAS
jgi:nucleoredoxin